MQEKLKTKVIKIKGDKQKEFIKILAARFGVTSEIELECLYVLVLNDMFTPFYLDKYTKAKMMSAVGVTENTFVVSMNRLVSKGVMARNEKSYFLNVAFRDLDKVDYLVFKVS